MFIVKDGYIYVGVSLLLAAIVYYFFGAVWAVIPVVLALYFAYFFRDFHRVTPYDPNILYSPADGTVMGVDEIFDGEYLNEPATKVTIFLSVFNVHVDRSPIAGKVTYQKYICGRFMPASKDEVGFENERHLLGIENDKMGITVPQIAGILARRIVSWITLDDTMEKGQVYGLIKFASCTEIVVPRNVEIQVKKGDKVRGGESIIGRVIE